MPAPSYLKNSTWDKGSRHVYPAGLTLPKCFVISDGESYPDGEDSCEQIITKAKVWKSKVKAPLYMVKFSPCWIHQKEMKILLGSGRGPEFKTIRHNDGKTLVEWKVNRCDNLGFHRGVGKQLTDFWGLLEEILDFKHCTNLMYASVPTPGLYEREPPNVLLRVRWRLYRSAVWESPEHVYWALQYLKETKHNEQHGNLMEQLSKCTKEALGTGVIDWMTSGAPCNR